MTRLIAGWAQHSLKHACNIASRMRTATDIKIIRVQHKSNMCALMPLALAPITRFFLLYKIMSLLNLDRDWFLILSWLCWTTVMSYIYTPPLKAYSTWIPFMMKLWGSSPILNVSHIIVWCMLVLDGLLCLLVNHSLITGIFWFICLF